LLTLKGVGLAFKMYIMRTHNFLPERNLLILLMLFLAVTLFAQQPNPPGQATKAEEVKNEAYLFAHMMHADYGRLYYSVSTDGLHWQQLNNGKRVSETYRGHPDIP
jgi:hypothetical protein